jgi:serine/threonine-protein kinase HipA
MTMLGLTDDADFSTGASYLSMVEFIIARGDNVDNNLEELWRRIVFHIAVSNCDDHLRNHGFLLTKRGWVLSPAYDVNPDEYGTGLKLNISEDDNSLDFDLAMSVSPYFRLTKERAASILSHVKKSVSEWRRIASKYNISKTEQALMESAFQY